MAVAHRVRVTCPRCGAPVTGDFKFCPTCACRLKPGPAEPEPAASPKPRSLAATLLALGVALFVGLLAGVGFWIFREPPRSPSAVPPPRSPVLLPETLRLSTLRKYLKRVPDGTAYWALKDGTRSYSADDPDRVRVYAPELDVLIYEVPRGFYAEFLADLRERLGRGEALGPTLAGLWGAKEPEDTAYARRYLEAWIDAFAKHQSRGVEAVLEPLAGFLPADRRDPVPKTAHDFAEAVAFPWSSELGLLLLAPPSWAFVDDFGQVFWKVPADTDTLPVTGVAWTDAVAFGEWATAALGGRLTVRLPVEGEWIRVAHGGHPPGDPDGNEWEYPWGNEPLRHACNSLDAYPPHSLLPALREVNELYNDTDAAGERHDGLTVDGIFAMAGNAREWVLRQSEHLQQVGEVLRVSYSEPGRNELRRLMAPTYGGSYLRPILDCKATSSDDEYKWTREDDIGFRVVAEPEL